MIEIIINEVVELSRPYLLLAAITGFYVVYAIGVIQSIKKGITLTELFREHKLKYFLMYLFYVYLVIVFALTILSRESGSRGDVSLKLFDTFTGDIMGDKNPIENILLFIPLGFLMPLLWKRYYKGLWCLATGLMLSLSIEGIQYVTGRGYVQTDDVVMNFAGTFIGYTVIYCCKQASLWIRSRKIMKE